MQAYLFSHLKKKLSSEYNIFVEATVRVPQEIDTKNSFKRIAVDMLICKGDAIFGVLEIKFSPKGQGKISGIRKDILRLSDIRNRRSRVDRVKIEISRYRHSEVELLSLKIHPSRKLIFAAFGKEDGRRLNEDSFWSSHVPKEGRWNSKSTCPPQFCVALAQTNESGGGKALFFGPPFDRTRNLTK